MVASTDHEKASLLAEQFYSVSATKNYTPEFSSVIPVIKRALTDINDRPCLDERLNILFSDEEIYAALHETKNSSPGGDRICYEMIKHLPPCSITLILQLYNNVWLSGYVPKIWRHSIVVPIHKPNKPNHLPSSYRPISLTSTMCKLMEKMVENRLSWYLEKNNLINNFQCGFRKRRRTTDHILRLHDTIYKALANKRFVIAVFLDLEKAYDMVFNDAVILKLIKLGINGRILAFINSFLSNRSFQVRIGASYSQEKCLENGLPQGSILSPLLFSVMINDLSEMLNCPFALYADDCCFWQTGTDILDLNKNIQQQLHQINEWCQKWGFKISAPKSAAMLFTKKGKWNH